MHTTELASPKANTNVSTLSSFFSRGVRAKRLTETAINGTPLNLQSAFVFSEPFSIEATDQASLDDMLRIASRELARNVENMDIVRQALMSPTILSRVSARLNLDTIRFVKHGQPILTIDTLLDAVTTVCHKSSISSTAAHLAITALLGKALTDFGLVKITDGYINIEVEAGLIPSWNDIRSEAIQREFENAFGAVNMKDSIEGKSVAGTLILPPLRAKLREVATHLEGSRSRVQAVDILGAAAVVSSLDFPSKNDIFEGMLTDTTVMQANANWTFISQFAAQELPADKLTNLLNLAPKMTISKTMSMAFQSITASGRIKQIDLKDFVRNSEVLIVDDLNRMPLRLFVAAAYQGSNYRAQVSHFEEDGAAYSAMNIDVMEEALNQHVPSVIQTVSHGVLAPFANVVRIVEGAKYKRRSAGEFATDEEIERSG